VAAATTLNGGASGLQPAQLWRCGSNRGGANPPGYQVVGRETSASPAEVRLAEETLATIRVGRQHRGGHLGQKPARVIADKGDDSDALHDRLAQRGIELIAPHRKNLRKPPTQDGRALRRYQRRWTVERTFAWFGNFPRLVVRSHRSLTVYRGFFHIACFMIVLRRILK